MRRARIKAVATVPVRRKTAAQTVLTDTEKQTDGKLEVKVPEIRLDAKENITPPAIDNSEPKVVDVKFDKIECAITNYNQVNGVDCIAVSPNVDSSSIEQKNKVYFEIFIILTDKSILN